MNIKLKWKVSSEPTGPYRSFQFRGWPTAEFEMNGAMWSAGFIMCEDDYRPARVKTGEHKELEVWFRDWRDNKNKRLKARFKTLAEAKVGLLDFLQRHPEVMSPK